MQFATFSDYIESMLPNGLLTFLVETRTQKVENRIRSNHGLRVSAA
jgi:hypothetical protein